MAGKKCLVGSDEEDEDGNLFEANLGRTAKNPSKDVGLLPMTEVVFLASDTTSFQPEDVEEITDRPIPTFYLVNSTDDEDSDIKIIEPPNDPPIIIEDDGDVVQPILLKPTSLKDQQKSKIKDLKVEVSDNQNDSNQKKNLLNGSSSLNIEATAVSKIIKTELLTPVAKPNNNNSSTVQAGCHRGQRRSKYSRLITPVCDSIMKDYNKDLDETDNTVNSCASSNSNVTVKISGESDLVDSINSLKTNLSSSSSTPKTDNNKDADPLSTKIKKEIKNEMVDVGLESDTGIYIEENVKHTINNRNLTLTTPLHGKKVISNTLTSQDPLTTPIKIEIKNEIVDLGIDSNVYIDENVKSTPSSQNLTTKTPLYENKPMCNSLISQDKSNFVFLSSGQQTNVLLNSRKRKSLEKDEYDDPTYRPGMSKKKSTENSSYEPLSEIKGYIASKEPNKRGGQFENQSTSVNKVIKNRGRPCKVKNLIKRTVEEVNNVQTTKDLLPKKRGRPPKHKKTESQQKVNLSTESTTINSFKLTNCEEPAETTIHESQEPEIKAKIVAEKLKLLVDKITDRLEGDQLSNIEKDTETLLQTTQELLELQKQKSQPSSNPPFCSLGVSSTGSNQESTDISSCLSISNQTPMKPSSLQETINKLVFRQYNPNDNNVTQTNTNPTLFYGLGKFVPKNVNTHEIVHKNSNELRLPSNSDYTRSKASSISPSLAHDNLLEDNGFVMNYFLSYQNVFDDKVISSVIPNLAEIILLCMDDFTEFVKRLKRAQNISSEELREQEIMLARNSFATVILTYGPSFFPKFSAVVNKIDEFKKMDKALIVTFLLFILNSVISKAPRFKGEVHLLRNVLVFMCIKHRYIHNSVWSVLKLSKGIFNETVTLIIKALIYCDNKKLIYVPGKPSLFVEYLLGGHMSLDTAMSSTTVFCEDTGVTKGQDMTLDTSVYTLDNQLLVNQSPLFSSSRADEISMPNLSDIAVHFVETLQSERHSDSKRIEEKLDSILSELRNDKLAANRQVSSRSFPQNSRNTSKSFQGFEGLASQLNHKKLLNPPESSKNECSISSEALGGIGLDNIFKHFFVKSEEQFSVNSEFVDREEDKSKLLSDNTSISEESAIRVLLEPDNIELPSQLAHGQNISHIPLSMEECDVSEDLDSLFYKENAEDPLSF